jgi:predicted transcriptional regulator
MAQDLSRRERQAMDIVYAKGSVRAADVQAELPDKPSYSATRVLMQRLHKKGLLKYQTDGPRYVYSATTPRSDAGRTALRRLVRTFFDGSKVRTMTALLGSTEDLSDEELDELERLIEKARSKKR